MTLPSSGQISVSDIDAEVSPKPGGYSASLGFLNELIKPAQRPASPNLDSFHGKAYYNRNADGNCANGNCGDCNNCANGNCTSACNCGNINCTNCLITGQVNCSVCNNCSSVNCANCDTQDWLQSDCNCAPTYNCNCNAAVSYNCVTTTTSYACNCACNCSKIICAKLYEFGMMDYRVWMADQQYGEWLKKHDRSVYKGYIKWARIVTAWMDGNGPDYLIWIRDKQLRSAEQKRTSTEWAQKIGTPWAEHMAFLMGAVPNDNLKGRVIMTIGRPICKFVNMLPKRSNPGTLTTWMMWSMFFMSHYVSEGVVRSARLIKKIKSLKIVNAVKRTTS